MSDERIINVTLSTDVASILPTNEMVGLMLTAGAKKSDLQDLQKNPGDFLNTQYNVAVPEGFSVNVVENNSNEMHLALPYYESFDSIDASLLSDDVMKQISGGEIIFFLIPALIGAKIAAVVGVTTATAAVTIGTGIAAGATLTTAVVVPATAGAIAAGAAAGAAVGGAVAAGVGGIAAAGAVAGTRKGK